MTTLLKHLQHQVRARVLTGAGWLEGNFHLSQLHGFSQYLSKNAWYPLTEVVMAQVGALPFFQLSRAETVLVVISSATRPPPSFSSGARPQDARFVLTHGAVDGVVQLPTRLRLSDFMDNSTGFIHLQHAAVRVWAEANAQSFDDVLLNPQRVVGVIETGQPSQSEPAVAS